MVIVSVGASAAATVAADAGCVCGWGGGVCVGGGGGALGVGLGSLGWDQGGAAGCVGGGGGGMVGGGGQLGLALQGQGPRRATGPTCLSPKCSADHKPVRFRGSVEPGQSHGDEGRERGQALWQPAIWQIHHSGGQVRGAKGGGRAGSGGLAAGWQRRRHRCGSARPVHPRGGPPLTLCLLACWLPLRAGAAFRCQPGALAWLRVGWGPQPKCGAAPGRGLAVGDPGVMRLPAGEEVGPPGRGGPTTTASIGS